VTLLIQLDQLSEMKTKTMFSATTKQNGVLLDTVEINPSDLSQSVDMKKILQTLHSKTNTLITEKCLEEANFLSLKQCHSEIKKNKNIEETG
jgi:hypothetical protein